jgi:hypothetical protein
MMWIHVATLRDGRSWDLNPRCAAEGAWWSELSPTLTTLDVQQLLWRRAGHLAWCGGARLALVDLLPGVV